MTSLFFRRDQPAKLHKLVNTSQEWCGTTAKYFLNKGRNYTFGYNSYWDGQGVGETTVDGGILFEDQLSYSLRALKFAEGLSFARAAGRVAGKQQRPVCLKYTKQPSRSAGLLIFRWTRTMTSGRRRCGTYAFNWIRIKSTTTGFRGEYPNVMLRQSTWDGQELQLKEAYMDDYWVIG